MVAARHWIPFGFLALIPLGIWLGGAWTFLLGGALPVILTLCDWLFGVESEISTPSQGAPYRLAAWLYIPLQLATTIWAGAVIAQPSTSPFESIGLTLSVGVAAGVFGFVAAHEMIHSRHPAERLLGLAMLAGLLDMPFAISHLQGHHRRAATYDDPASARRGESVYAFLVRSLCGQAREVWAFEARRLVHAGRSAFSLRNRLIAFALTEAGLAIAVGLFSLRALAFFLAQAALAVALLECFNYVAHYGLCRRTGPDGRLEPLNPRHSWNTARRMNNAALCNMGRHADHHRFSARPYHELEVLEGGSELPCGYAGVLLMALVPPLWRRVMDPRADRAMARGSWAPERRSGGSRRAA